MNIYDVPPVPDSLTEQGACVGHSWVPPESWTDYSAGHAATADAIAVCGECVVVAACSQWAAQANPRGVWGGKWRAGRTRQLTSSPTP